MALLLRGVDDVLLGRAPQRLVEHPAQRAVGGDRCDRDGGERRVVDDHHRERRERHHAVDERFDEARGERALDGVHRAEARDDVAEVALLEPAHGKPQQVREDVREPLQVERGAEVEHDPRAQRRERDVGDGEEQEPEPQHGEEIAIGGNDSSVHGPLNVERAHDRDRLQCERDDEHLRQRAVQPRHRPGEIGHAHAAPLVRRLELRGRREL